MNRAYQDFVENIPFYGFAVLCTDHPQVQALAARVQDRRTITYGFNPQADFCAVNVRPGKEGSSFDLLARRRGNGVAMAMEDVFLPVPGRHNVQNAIAAIAVARELGASKEAIRAGLKAFTGVKRRFTTVGEWRGVRIVDDYAHHPVEIAAVLRTAREVADGRVIAVAQPHRYSRLKALFQEFSTCFNDADVVAIADVYAAGEAPLEGARAEDLVQSLGYHGHRKARKLALAEDLPEFVRSEAKPGDVVIFLGAGDITAHAYGLIGRLG